MANKGYGSDIGGDASCIVAGYNASTGVLLRVFLDWSSCMFVWCRFLLPRGFACSLLNGTCNRDARLSSIEAHFKASDSVDNRGVLRYRARYGLSW